MEWSRGTIGSAVLHGVFILWVIFGDWLFAPDDAEEIPVAEVSLMTSAEFEELAQTATGALPPVSSTPPQQRPAPEPEAVPEDIPEGEDLQPDPAPTPEAPVADAPQPIPVPDTEVPPAPRPIDRVADTPVDDTTDTPEIADTVSPAVTDEPAEEVPETPPEPEASPEEAATQIITEAVETEDDAPQLAPTASMRPQARPKPTTEELPPTEETIEPEPEPEPETETTDTAAVEDALAEALAEADTPAPDASTPAGPPMSAGEQDALRVAIKKCWNLGALSSEAMRTTVTVYVALAQDGTPDLGSLELIGTEGGNDASAQVMFTAARSAIARCGKSGFPLPVDKYETWKELELVFDPTGMRLR